MSLQAGPTVWFAVVPVLAVQFLWGWLLAGDLTVGQQCYRLHHVGILFVLRVFPRQAICLVDAACFGTECCGYSFAGAMGPSHSAWSLLWCMRFMRKL